MPLSKNPCECSTCCASDIISAQRVESVEAKKDVIGHISPFQHQHSLLSYRQRSNSANTALAASRSFVIVLIIKVNFLKSTFVNFFSQRSANSFSITFLLDVLDRVPRDKGGGGMFFAANSLLRAERLRAIAF
jgi:hypothetical protein